MGIKEAYKEIKEDAIFTYNKYKTLMEGKNTWPATIDSIPYEEGRSDALAEVVMVIERECPEVLEQTEEEWLDAIKRNNED